MTQRFCWLKAAICVMTAIVSICYGYNDDNGDRKLKHVAMEYGDVLTSFENVENYIRSDGNVKLSRLQLNLSSTSALSSTRCTTEGSVTLDPTYDPSSDEKDKGTTKAADSQSKEQTGTQGELAEKKGIDDGFQKQPQKKYKPPAVTKKPDHYIDDP